MPKIVRVLLPIILITLSIPLYFLYVDQNAQSIALPNITVAQDLYKSHILGGFSLSTPDIIQNAHSNGIQVEFRYGGAPNPTDAQGQKLKALNMKVIDGFVASYLEYYECHRTKTIIPPPAGQGQYCRQDSHPELANEQALLSAIEQHLKAVQNNQLVIGYWILDDWVPWDTGSAKALLSKIHDLIHRYTPTRPAICGFGQPSTALDR
ncbi:hypothetical protein [Dictyobacter kobayashii]|uniref:GH26 domain-containing protein n=1 Tax=Dictyobacter kobayashii TaxID=2014872 RepID=A0A402AP30_9CHLR|nr:hypothetical protein [Dictyobacter kobayashii]GCE20951.1 hypothetical protein KDK_47510 [Dictyobacter kobayashii]